jgi:hypothetical protein
VVKLPPGNHSFHVKSAHQGGQGGGKTQGFGKEFESKSGQRDRERR